MNKFLLIIIIISYLAGIFYIAFWAEKSKKSKWVNHPLVYTLSLAVYCTAWTYYGSIGLAVDNSYEFLPIYLGPVIALPLWVVFTKKIIYLTKSHNISSMADFISLRYGNSRMLGAIVTLICLVAIVPYLSLQIKAVSESFQILVGEEFIHQYLWLDFTFYITCILALFASFFGTRSSDASNRKTGIVFSVAVESVLKLSFFVAFGLYVVFYLFDGTQDLYNQINASHPELLATKLNLVGGLNWMFGIALSFMVMFLLPRQFQMGVVEYVGRFQMKTAIWAFPLYLLIFNLFVLFIAWAGMILIGGSPNQDYYSLLIPLAQGHKFVAILVFLGGFSAVISMVVVSSIALATMLSNNVIIPYGYLDVFAKRFSVENEKSIKLIRRVTIILLIFFAYFLYINWQKELPLISIGLISFVIISQLAPSFFIGLYWSRGSALAAKLSILSGFAMVGITLLIPFTYNAVYNDASIIENGYFGMETLRPYALFGLDYLTPINHAFCWSLIVNMMVYLILSVSFKGHYRERNYGEMFVNAVEISGLQENAFVWKGEAYYADIQELLFRFLGEERGGRAIRIFKRKYNISNQEKLADARFINFSEKLLTGTIGSASARILISSVVKEKPVTLPEVLNMLEDNKEARFANKQLTAQSRKLTKLTEELKNANQELIDIDRQKDSFLDTVAHELKTPLTSIKAASEVLQDDDMPLEIRQQFLKNIENDTERLSKLINNILNLEKLASGREVLDFRKHDVTKIITEAIHILQPLAIKNNVVIDFNGELEAKILLDKDKILQVLTNLLGNALKFVPEQHGKIEINLQAQEHTVSITVLDNGKGIAKEDLPYIFDKFYQSKNQNLIKPSGSGFGLAISKQIIEMHQGTITVMNNEDHGAKFIIEIPKDK
ncbi:sodium:proline symporter [Flavobacteriaceae bacterium Ap0902]|nr:sodium:proline symporter [Flavobacteriaceae bacterium Ap0902]